MSDPPKYRCTLDGEFHDCYYSCDKFDNTSTYVTIKGNVIENYDMKLNSTSTTRSTIKVDNEKPIETHCNRGCSTCTDSDEYCHEAI